MSLIAMMVMTSCGSVTAATGAEERFVVKNDELIDLPLGDAPSEEDGKYVHTVVEDLGTEDFNNETKTVKRTQIAGKKIVIRKDYTNGLYRQLTDTSNLKSLTIYAETLIIGSALHLPETNVEIYAGELVFEDSPNETASIITTPMKSPLAADQFQPGKDGLPAGNITLHVGKLISNMADAKRFIACGGDGQDGGIGKDGDPGDSMPPLRSDYHSGRWWLIIGNLPNSSPNYPKNPNYMQKSVVFFREQFLGSSDYVAGKERWPGHGFAAKPGGKPGEGGLGGTILSNVDIGTMADVGGGDSGKKAPDYTGGDPGTPNPAYHAKCGGDSIIDEHFQNHGANAVSPSAIQPNGPDGTILPPLPNDVWVHARWLKPSLRYAEDLYYLRRYESAKQLLDKYQGLVANVPQRSRDDDSSADDLAWLRQRISCLRLQLAHGLDFYGYPAGWAPLLSLEVYYESFRNECEAAVGMLHLADWLENSMSSAQQKMDILDKSIPAIKAEIESEVNEYGNLQESEMPVLQKKVAALEHDRDLAVQETQLREQELLHAAEDTVEKEKAKQEGLKAWRTFGTFYSLIPVGQPFTGMAGTAIKELASGQNALASARAAIQARSDAENYKADIKKFHDAFDKLDFSTIPKLEKTYKANKSDLLDGLDGVVHHVETELDDLAKRRTPDSDVAKELAALKGSDVDYQDRLKKAREFLDKQKETIASLMIVREKMFALLDDLSRNTELVSNLSDEYQRDANHVSLRGTMIMADIRSHAEDRLRKYHYLLAKAYEYRLLRPYTHDLLLDSTYQELKKLLAPENGVLTSTELKNVMDVYENQLKTVTEEILNSYEQEIQEQQIRRVVKLEPDEIEKLNKQSSLTINIENRPGFIGSFHEMNRRLMKVELYEIATNPQSASIDLAMDQLGSSKIRRASHTFAFRHERTNTPHRSWRFVYDAEYNLKESSSPSNFSQSLLYVLLQNNTPKLELFERPGLDGEISISKPPNSAGVTIEKVAFLVTYTFEPSSR